MQKNRIALYNRFRNNFNDDGSFDREFPNFQNWESRKFKDKTTVNKLWNKCLKTKGKKGKLFYELISEFTRTKKIEYFDLLEKICPINQCLTITDGVVLYQDSNHVNANGIDVIKSSATKIFD